MNKTQVKEILISILIGAVIAALTVVFEGLIDFLKGSENNIIGGISTTLSYLRFRRVI